MADFETFKAVMMRDDPTITHMLDRGDGTCLIVKRLMFHWTLLESTIGNEHGYDDRWCYQTEAEALNAAQLYINMGLDEPTGWHRHHATGRRRRYSEDGSYVEWIQH